MRHASNFNGFTLEILACPDATRKSPSPIYREISRITFHDRELPDYDGDYSTLANDLARERRCRLRKLRPHPNLREEIISQLKARWSSEQIAERLVSDGVSLVRVCKETTYRFTYNKEDYGLGLYQGFGRWDGRIQLVLRSQCTLAKRHGREHQQASSSLSTRQYRSDVGVTTRPDHACKASQQSAAQMPCIQDAGRDVHGQFARKRVIPYPSGTHDVFGLAPPNRAWLRLLMRRQSRKFDGCALAVRRDRHHRWPPLDRHSAGPFPAEPEDQLLCQY